MLGKSLGVKPTRLGPAVPLVPVVPPRKRTILRTRLNLRRFYIGFWPLVRPILRATPVPAVLNNFGLRYGLIEEMYGMIRRKISRVFFSIIISLQH